MIFLLLSISFEMFFAKRRPPIRGNGTGGVTPGDKPHTPIDMYEWGLLWVAVMLIVGYYFYSRRRIANS